MERAHLGNAWPGVTAGPSWTVLPKGRSGVFKFWRASSSHRSLPKSQRHPNSSTKTYLLKTNRLGPVFNPMAPNITIWPRATFLIKPNIYEHPVKWAIGLEEMLVERYYLSCLFLFIGQEALANYVSKKQKALKNRHKPKILKAELLTWPSAPFSQKVTRLTGAITLPW